MKRILTVTVLLLVSLAASQAAEFHVAWAPKRAPIMTRWAAQVDPRQPLPEYPRPQMERKEWRSLNGIWEFKAGGRADAVPVGQKLPGEILVPYPVESALSGVMQHHDRLWYRRLFAVPAEWKGRQILLHFGAVDYETEVFVNGKSLGVHRGGYDPFTCDLAGYLKPDGEQELIVRVFDPTEEGGQPRGKQTTKPEGIMYTPCSGIWQTVWLEPVARTSIENLKMVADTDRSRLCLTVQTRGPCKGVGVNVRVLDAGTVVQSMAGPVGAEFAIPLPKPKLWSADCPFLYDLEVDLVRDAAPVDCVKSYFGMRKVSVGDTNGVKRIFINGKPVFNIGLLDQGFWPDGIYTAPTDEALRYDIETAKAMGFNMVRKHIKVEPARWYYWADKLGLMVWQDMPSSNSYLGRTPPPVDKAAFELELGRMIRTLRNHPAIVLWVLFNEGQGQFDTERLVDVVRKLDPSRLVNEASGGDIVGSGDLNDTHSYPPPGIRPRTNDRQVFVCGEYGGIGYKVDAPTWSGSGGGYMNVETPEDLFYAYADFVGMLKKLRDEEGLGASVYTQLTDVETELNGLLTYDRLSKLDAASISRVNHFHLPQWTYQPVLPTSETVPQTWRYVETTPAGLWLTPAFDDSSWAEAPAPFGAAAGLTGKTPWKTKAIWMRKKFRVGTLAADEINNLVCRVFHDEDIELFINGVPALRQGGYVTTYRYLPLMQAGRRAIVPKAENVIAVKCIDRTGARMIDVGLYTRNRSDPRERRH
jgi:hypothetical protein